MKTWLLLELVLCRSMSDLNSPMLNWLLAGLVGCLSGGRAEGRVLSPAVVGGNCGPVVTNCL